MMKDTPTQTHTNTNTYTHTHINTYTHYYHEEMNGRNEEFYIYNPSPIIPRASSQHSIVRRASFI
jgi:hypothetical protein